MTLLAILFVAATVVLLAVVFVAVRLGDPPPPAVQRVFFHDRIIWVDHPSLARDGQRLLLPQLGKTFKITQVEIKNPQCTRCQIDGETWFLLTAPEIP